MTAVTKCQNAECILAPKCYRRTAKSHPLYQSYGMFHIDWMTGQCEYYIPALKTVRKEAKDGNHAEKCGSVLPELPTTDSRGAGEKV